VGTYQDEVPVCFGYDGSLRVSLHDCLHGDSELLQFRVQTGEVAAHLQHRKLHALTALFHGGRLLFPFKGSRLYFGNRLWEGEFRVSGINYSVCLTTVMHVLTLPFFLCCCKHFILLFRKDTDGNILILNLFNDTFQLCDCMNVKGKLRNM
jgi:hypothetical protein